MANTHLIQGEQGFAGNVKGVLTRGMSSPERLHIHVAGRLAAVRRRHHPIQIDQFVNQSLDLATGQQGLGNPPTTPLRPPLSPVPGPCARRHRQRALIWNSQKNAAFEIIERKWASYELDGRSLIAGEVSIRRDAVFPARRPLARNLAQDATGFAAAAGKSRGMRSLMAHAP